MLCLAANNALLVHWTKVAAPWMTVCVCVCSLCLPSDDELLVHWTKVAAPWMELPHCAYLTAVSALVWPPACTGKASV